MPENIFPWVVRPEAGESLVGRVRAERDTLRGRLRHRGALLFRGYDVGGVDGFAAVVRALAGEPLEYAERSSPRSTIKGQVYTSTDYPEHEEIFLHNENSYQTTWPRTLFFHCMVPPTSRGATPLADTREVLTAIDPAVREEFRARGWMVVRNFNAGLGQSWQQVFDTGDRAAVEAYCASRDIALEWRGAGLRTRAVRSAIHPNPHGGGEVWFNHATFFHVTTLAPDVRDGLRALYDDADLPTNTYFGDGGPVPDDVLDHLRSCYRGATTRFDYEQDDVLVIDNMLVAHGREPFTGPRRVAVAMAEPFSG